MLIQLHNQATTTPKIRAAIQASDEPAWMVAERYGISEQTVWKWRKRDSVYDHSKSTGSCSDGARGAPFAVPARFRRFGSIERKHVC
uniref:hypothetical protein n=1 Tax=Sedimentitalea todarodis TaxID=1631240 RepID=UPI0037421457